MIYYCYALCIYYYENIISTIYIISIISYYYSYLITIINNAYQIDLSLLNHHYHHHIITYLMCIFLNSVFI